MATQKLLVALVILLTISFTMGTKKTTLEVFHIGHLSLNNSNNIYPFQARMHRELKRVSSFGRRLKNGFGVEVIRAVEIGCAEYLVKIGIGNPPVEQFMVIDTTGALPWIQCQPCKKCYKQATSVFNPMDSTSFQNVACGSTACLLLDHKERNFYKGQCRYEVAYEDGTYSKGTVAFETLTLNGQVIKNIAIGCGYKNIGNFRGATGVLGLGGGRMSLLGQLGGQAGGVFAYCLTNYGSESSGWLEFGRGVLTVDVVWVRLHFNRYAPYFYYIELLGIGVGNVRLPISEDVFQLKMEQGGKGGVILDTGTIVSRFPYKVYEALRDAFLERVADDIPRAAGVSIFDTCFDLSATPIAQFPNISFFFRESILTILPHNVVTRLDDVGTFCFAFAPTSDAFSIIGNIQQRNVQITIDASQDAVGFGPNSC